MVSELHPINSEISTAALNVLLMQRSLSTHKMQTNETRLTDFHLPVVKRHQLP